jgi:hypothetical protein
MKWLKNMMSEFYHILEQPQAVRSGSIVWGLR